MKYYNLTEEAEEQYKKSSKRYQRIKFKREIIEKRLNAMISISKDIYYFSDTDFEAGIFSCIIKVINNEITGIRWCNDSHFSKPEKNSFKKLRLAYQVYGLNKCGEKIIYPTSEIQSECPAANTGILIDETEGHKDIDNQI
jgi:hypothetical protein